MTRSGSSRVCGAGALALLGMAVTAMAGIVAASPGSKVSMEEAARSQLSRFRTQKSSATHQVSIEDAVSSQLSRFRAQKWNGEDHITGAARVPGGRAPSATGAERVAPAGRHWVPQEGVRVAPTSATGAHTRLMSASQREALSARVKDTRDGAGDLTGKADDQSPQKMVGTDHSAHDVTDPSSNGGHRRKLQSCLDGSGVTVTSSEFPLLEGCLAEYEYADGVVEFVSSTGAIIPIVPDGETSAIWVALYGDTTSPEELVSVCLSVESSIVHPSEATWACTFGGDTLEYATSTTFGVDCGCDSDGGSFPAPTPSPPTPTPPTPSTGSSCAEGSGVTVTSSEFPLLEGCLEELDFLDTAAGPEFVSATGLILYALLEGGTTPFWFAFYGDIAAAEFELGCLSEESADAVHPSEATWICMVAEDTFDYATSTTFSVDCGCDGDAVSPVPAPTDPPVVETPSPVPAPTDPPVVETPAPVPAPTDPPVVETPSPTPGSRAIPTTPAPEASSSSTASPPTPAASGDCAADSSLGVTSTAFPLLEGCLEEVVLVTGGELEYMSSTGLIVALALDEATPTLEYWFAGYGDTTVLEELQTACLSEQLASTVHPSEATWICLDAAGETYNPTGSQFVIDCGCSTAPSPETPAPTSVATQPTGGLATPEPTSGPSATDRGFGSPAPTPSIGADPSGVPAVVFPPDVTTPAPSAAGSVADSCGATESFRVTSSALPDVQGCYQSTDESFSNPGSFAEVWTVSGTTTTEQIGVIGWAEGGEVEAAAYPYMLAFVSSDADNTIIYCISSEDAITVHPVDATWICDLDGTESFAEVNDADISFTCGCTGTPAPVSEATPITAPTSSPGSAPTDGASTTSGSVTAHVLYSPSVAGATMFVTAAAVALTMGG